MSQPSNSSFPPTPGNSSLPPGESPPSRSATSNTPNASAAVAAFSSSCPAVHQYMPHEERLHLWWRKMLVTMTEYLRKTEKGYQQAGTTTSTTAGGGSNPSPPAPPLTTADRRALLKEADEALVSFLKAKTEYMRLLNHVEAKLQGKQEEMESLETYVKTQAKVGGRKRQRRGDE